MVAEKKQLSIDTRHYHVLSLIPPFVDVCLGSIAIKQPEFAKIVELAGSYPNDPRLIQMVRLAGDASAKVPYLLDESETPGSILAELRQLARPHVERIKSLPDQVQAAMHLLLSMNVVPDGCEAAAIPALLEFDRIQEAMVAELHERMSGRQLARDFQESNLAALRMLDQDWPDLRGEASGLRRRGLLPESASMQYQPFFDRTGRLISLHEICAILDAPHAHALQALTPPVLKRPLPAEVPVPLTGSVDWLIREVGKVGRHVTRALLEIIKAHLAAERISLEARNYALINQQAVEALREYIEKNP
ncbi:MAG TPA: hypothetical protein VMT91_11265 [Anaerolineales bacterium]|nr:hypothetical protein [Anaerolineales bacterium]